jgi:hypothetical protein
MGDMGARGGGKLYLAKIQRKNIIFSMGANNVQVN